MIALSPSNKSTINTMEKFIPVIAAIVGFWFVFGVVISRLGHRKPSAKESLKTGGQSVAWLLIAVVALAILGAIWSTIK